MEKVTALAKETSKEISGLIRETDRYKEYQKARAAIYADKELHKKIEDFLEKHVRFLNAMKDGTASFEEERYLSQEFHKLMLNRNVNIYFNTGLYFVETLADFYSACIEGLDIDLDFGG